jgi:hypothetical protein
MIELAKMAATIKAQQEWLDSLKKPDYYRQTIEGLTTEQIAAMFDTLRVRINKATEMAVQAMGIYADAEFKDLPDDMLVFRNIIDVLQGKGE